jgi:hypothetical protein
MNEPQITGVAIRPTTILQAIDALAGPHAREQVKGIVQSTLHDA